MKEPTIVRDQPPRQPPPAKRPRDYTLEDYADHLNFAQGFISAAAHNMGVSRRTVERKIEKSQRLKELLSDHHGAHGDLAENKLLAAVQRGEPWAIQFYLQTKHKDRGYTYRTQIELPGFTREELLSLSDEEFERRAKELGV